MTNKQRDYLFNQLFPKLAKDSQRLTVDPMAGSITINLQTAVLFKKTFWFYIHATPFWEGSDGIDIALSKEDGTYIDTDETLGYSLTYDVKTDTENYHKTVNGWINNHLT